MTHRTVHIPTIVCDHCIRTIRLELQALEGVVSVEGDHGKRTVTITWSEPASWDTIRATLEGIGYAPE